MNMICVILSDVGALLTGIRVWAGTLSSLTLGITPISWILASAFGSMPSVGYCSEADPGRVGAVDWSLTRGGNVCSHDALWSQPFHETASPNGRGAGSFKVFVAFILISSDWQQDVFLTYTPACGHVVERFGDKEGHVLPRSQLRKILQIHQQEVHSKQVTVSNCYV